MGAVIGSVALDYDLYWETKPSPGELAFEKRTLSGKLCSCVLSAITDKVHTFQFTWITKSQWEKLKNMAESQETFNFRPAENASTYTARFVTGPDAVEATPIVGVNENTEISHERLQEFDIDLYYGTI